jgi:hypothetical protein
MSACRRAIPVAAESAALVIDDTAMGGADWTVPTTIDDSNPRSLVESAFPGAPTYALCKTHNSGEASASGLHAGQSYPANRP